MLRTLSIVLLAAACSSETGPDGETPDGLACPDPAAERGALGFDGVDDYAATAVRPELGLTTFTVESWVRRDGDGVTFTSGNGGLHLVPIASKGLGEGDRSNVDCNYAFGFWGDVLGADFEDMTTGANHPVTGTTAISRGEWHHVAVTFDGTTLRLYLDGKLDGKAAAAATPRADSIHPFAIGTAIDSEGAPHGFLHGAVDEVRLWNRARTAEEIADGMHRTIAMSDALVGRWALDAGGDGTTAADSVGMSPATITGATPITEGVVLDRGAAPVVAMAAPGDDAMVMSDVTLDLDLEMAAKAPVDVTYHVRELGDADDFTIVVLPDTQIYTIEGRNLERFFHDQTKWIREHRTDYNIVGVIHNGDLINNEPLMYQWRVADAAMSRLETPEADLPEGMPYGITLGNHDNKQVGGNTVENTDKFNDFFGVARFAKRSYYGGHYGTRNDNSWFTFSAGGLDFVVVNVMYDLTPDPAVLTWAHSVFEMHPDAFGILNTHYLLGAGGSFGPQAKTIYAALKDLPNLHLMTGGHISAESRRVDTFAGHKIHSMLADYQGRDQGGAGFMRIWEFSPVNGTVTVRSYSPTLDKFETDANSEFTLPVDLRGAGGAFRQIALADASPDAVSTPAGALEVGKTYEWYADVDSCGQRTKTPLYRFTTVSGAREQDRAIQQPPRRYRPEPVADGPVDVSPDDPSLAD